MENQQEPPLQDKEGVSVVIAHYAPAGGEVDYCALLMQTIKSVRTQLTAFPVEVVVCDDGSAWSAGLCTSTSVTVYDRCVASMPRLLEELDVDRYLLLPDVGLYRGVQLKQSAILGSRYCKVVILDDDHPFLRLDSLARYYRYLDRFVYVRGRVVGPRGLPQSFLSRNAQGTNYGIRKELFQHIDGFGRYLWDNGYGEDNDMLWRVYSALKVNPEFRACFAGEIVTRDLASNRWVSRSGEGEKGSPETLQMAPHKRYLGFVQDFQRAYGIHPYHRNASRNKWGWVVFPSTTSLVSEFRFLLVFFVYYPAEVLFRLQEGWRRGGANLLLQKIWARLFRPKRLE